MTASLPSQTILGTTASDIRSTTPGVAALVDTFQAADTITLNNDGDYANGGDGNDSILIGGTASVSLANSVVAGDGADTITIFTGAALLASVGFSVSTNQGNDSIFFGSAGGQSYLLNEAFVAGGLGNDTIFISSAVTQAINATINGGENADSILVTSGGGVLTNSVIAGNKGADTIVVTSTSALSSSINGGEGLDSITIGSGAEVGLVNGGAGIDTIRLLTGANATTIVGGGLGDSIVLATAGLNKITIYGDQLGVTTEGTGTGGTADGNDFIGGVNVRL